MTSSFSDDTGRIQSGQSHSDSRSNLVSSHCGGGTGAVEWSVSTGRGAVGSVRGETGRRRKIV